MHTGLVKKSTGQFYDLVLNNGEVCRAILGGKLRLNDNKETNPVAVGDRVIVEKMDDDWVIRQIQDRKNKISRQSSRNENKEHVIAANIDQVVVMASYKLPDLKLNFIDRCLLSAKAYDIEAAVLITKVDLIHSDKLIKSIEEIYELAGIPVYSVNLLADEDIQRIADLFKNKITAVAGLSGVGKSTLANRFNPNLDIKTQQISKKWKQGQHTTTFAEMHELFKDSYLIDTPGLREYALYNIESWELSHFFQEMIPHLENCRYSKCTHIHEPDCGVKHAMENGLIHPVRYESYVQIYHSLESNSY